MSSVSCPQYIGGGYADPIEFSCQVSSDNKNTLAALIQTTLSNTEVQFSFNVHDFDPEAGEYYKAFHSGDVCLFGLINSSGGELEIGIDTEPSMEVDSPQNFTFTMGVVPADIEQNLHLAVSVSDKFAKQWGIDIGGLGSGSSCQCFDSDCDGTPDASDGCPADANKTSPGQCGCGNPDTDSDHDGIADCNDACPLDPDNDIDGDSVCGNVDNCPAVENGNQENIDYDSLGDMCDPDADGDGYEGALGSNDDCNDYDFAINPGGEETCDGKDNDCSESTADGSSETWLGDPTDCSFGKCRATGNLVCLNGLQTDTCIPGIPGVEVCDGLDNDCNNVIDNDLTASANSLQTGVCSGSTKSCSGAGGWVDDYSGIATFEEGNETLCDTLDNDCDGITDEGEICRERALWLMILPAILQPEK